MADWTAGYVTDVDYTFEDLDGPVRLDPGDHAAVAAYRGTGSAIAACSAVSPDGAEWAKAASMAT